MSAQARLKCGYCGKAIGDQHSAYVVNDRPTCAACAARFGTGKKWSVGRILPIVGIALIVVPILIIAIKNGGSGLGHGFSSRSGQRYDADSLDIESLVGVECLYTDYGYGSELSVLGSTEKVSVPKMSRLTVQKVIHEQATDYDHPNSMGYKFYVTSPTAPGKTLVMYPNGVNLNKYNGHTSWYFLQLCPVSQYDLAVTSWKGKTFQYNGTKMGEIEVQNGTVITVTDVEPIQYGTFSVKCTLPSGMSASTGLGLDSWNYVLKPVGTAAPNAQ